MPISAEELQVYRAQVICSFEELEGAFGDCMEEALARLSADGVRRYLEGASICGRIGRGFEPVLVYLEEMPEVAERIGEDALEGVSQAVWKISRTPNGKAILPFVQTMGEAARRLGALEPFKRYIAIILDMMDRTTGSIHGFHTTIPSPALPELLAQVPYLLSQLSLEGIKNWVDYGVRYYHDHPERQRDFFTLQTADSRAILQRERHGTLFADVERRLDLYMRALWNEKTHFIPYTTGFDELRKPVPYYDERGIRVPDVYDNTAEGADVVSGIHRYVALLAHIAAHRRWTQAIVADNFSPFQRIAIEMFEDCRVEALAMMRYPGLRSLWASLHPRPIEGDCEPERQSCIRHRLAMFSYATLNPDHGYKNADINEYVARFRDLASGPKSSTEAVADLAISFVTRTRRQEDQLANVYFKDTEIAYRDDNRHMWQFIEMGDEEEMFDQREKSAEEESQASHGLPPRHYPEWDYQTQAYRPDWVSVYESLHPSADGGIIDAILNKHAHLAKRLKQLLDLLKPQRYVRLRYQEEGSELDLDVAIRSLIDYKSGTTPDPRINMSHRHDGRDIAVSLLLDLSESLNGVPEGGDQSILQLSQEAVALLAWAIDCLGDRFAIAGFSSNTRHEVRYQHIKGYGETWDAAVKARLAAMQAAYSTRMGAAIRHAGHYLGARQAEKRLLLVLSDGEPADIDVHDARALIEDARRAVLELERTNIYTFCITLDRKADAYIGDIFGQRFAVIDNVSRLPEQLPQIFMSLTK